MAHPHASGWKELESDPGLFTLLIKDFGVEGVKVREIYDLEESIHGTVYGFIFLFKWNEVGRSRRKIQPVSKDCFCTDPDVVNKMFFAHQVIPNSCATHALLSVLLNCENIDLGKLINRLKTDTQNFSPEDKGYAISNIPELALAHSKHARPESNPLAESMEDKPNGITSNTRTMEAFHFTCYLPLNGHLFELDGLKQHPIDHGPLPDGVPWHDMARTVVTERIKIATGGELSHDIRYNLMAVIPCPIEEYEGKIQRVRKSMQDLLSELSDNIAYSQQLATESIEVADELKSLRSFVDDAEIFCAVSQQKDIPTCSSSDQVSTSRCVAYIESSQQSLYQLLKHYDLLAYIDKKSEEDGACDVTISDVVCVLQKLRFDIEQHLSLVHDEREKLEKYKIDDTRRTHDYIPFISLFLAMMQEQNLLDPLLDQNSLNRKRSKTSLNQSRKKPEKKRRRK